MFKSPAEEVKSLIAEAAKRPEAQLKTLQDNNEMDVCEKYTRLQSLKEESEKRGMHAIRFRNRFVKFMMGALLALGSTVVTGLLVADKSVKDTFNNVTFYGAVTLVATTLFGSGFFKKRVKAVGDERMNCLNINLAILDLEKNHSHALANNKELCRKFPHLMRFEMVAQGNLLANPANDYLQDEPLSRKQPVLCRPE